MSGSASRSFNDLLRRYRLDAALTQEALAERAGLSVRGLSDLERGVNRAPYVATVVRLADALNLSDAQRAELESTISRHRGPPNQRAAVHLPRQLTSLVGRDGDIDTISNVFRWEGRRLVTLVGPGGVGKTRLAIQIATTIASDFDGGAYFVPLEEVIDAVEVGTAIAAALQIRDGTRSVDDLLVDHLTDREVLLVLDGYEHLMAGAALPGYLLVRCPRVKILVTSRAPLHVRGEHEFPVNALPVPPSEQSIDLDTLVLNPAVALFVETEPRRSTRFLRHPGFGSRGGGDLPPSRWSPPRHRARRRSQQDSLARRIAVSVGAPLEPLDRRPQRYPTPPADHAKHRCLELRSAARGCPGPLPPCLCIQRLVWRRGSWRRARHSALLRRRGDAAHPGG